MAHDETLAEAMHDLLHGSDPFVGDVVAGGVRRGRRLQRRRRGVQIAGATAAVVALGAGGAYLTGGGDTTTASGRKPILQELKNQITAQAPGTKMRATSHLPSSEGDSSTPANAAVTIGADPIATVISVSTSYSSSGFAGPPVSCPSSLDLSHGATCSSSKRADGSLLAVYQGPLNNENPEGPKIWAISIGYTDGDIVTLKEMRDGPADNVQTGPAFPLSIDQLTAIAESPTWHDRAVQVTLPPQNMPNLSTSALRPIAKSLIPKKLAITGTGMNPYD